MDSRESQMSSVNITIRALTYKLATIPGRPAMHERSISAPNGASWKPQHRLAEFTTFSSSQVLDERPELDGGYKPNTVQQRSVPGARQPLSPKSLTPLVIPPMASLTRHLSTQKSFSRLRSGSTPLEPTIRSARTDESPMTKVPFTPLSASTTLTTPRSAMTASTLPTPVSAPIDSRSSPKPWDRPSNPTAVTSSKEGVSEPTSMPKTSDAGLGHTRNHSESGSIMERGRPRKRGDKVEKAQAAPLKRTASKRSKSAERRAFEQLPKGWKASDAVKMMDPVEAALVQKQALQQASRFEVLRKEDVDDLSRVRSSSSHCTNMILTISATGITTSR